MDNKVESDKEGEAPLNSAIHQIWAEGSTIARNQWMLYPSNEELNIKDIREITRVTSGCNSLIGVGTLPLTIYAEGTNESDTRRVVSLDYLPTMVFPLLLAKYIEIQEISEKPHLLTPDSSLSKEQMQAANEFGNVAKDYLEEIFKSKPELLEAFNRRFPELNNTLHSVFGHYSYQKPTIAYLFDSTKRKGILKAVSEGRIEFSPVDFQDTKAVMNKLQPYNQDNIAVFLSNVCQSIENHQVLVELYEHERIKSIVLSVPALTGVPRPSSTGYYFEDLSESDYMTVTQTGIIFLVQAILKPD